MNNLSSGARGKWPITLLVIALITFAGWKIINTRLAANNIQSFDECVEAGNPVLESFPEQCIANGRTFVNTP